MLRQKLDPWIGLGFGYEWLNITMEGSMGGRSASITMTPHGFEFFNLQAGLDIQVVEHFYVGPFVTLAVAQADSRSVDCTTSVASFCDQFGASRDVRNKALHQWLLLGVRGTYAP
jgi:hypothetical protein